MSEDDLWRNILGPELDQVNSVIEHQKQQAREWRAGEEYNKRLARRDAEHRERQEAATARGPLEGRILSYAELRDLPRPQPLIQDVLYTGSIAIVLGNSQTGKTWVMLSIAAAAAAGMHWPVGAGAGQAPMSVLYVAAEDGGSIGARLECWENAHSISLDNHTFDAHPSPVDILDTVQIEELAAVIRERGYRLVIIDTVSASLGGEDEGNPQFAKAIQNMRILLAAMAANGGGSVILVHHFGKDRTKGGRGGSALFNDADIVWELEGTMHELTMTCTKWKADSLRDPFYLRLDKQDSTAVHITERDAPAYSTVAPDPRDKYAVLAASILKTVKDNLDLNRGYGPTGRQITGMLKEAGASFRTEAILDQLAAMSANGRLIAHPGPRNSTVYRLPPVQPTIYDED